MIVNHKIGDIYQKKAQINKFFKKAAGGITELELKSERTKKYFQSEDFFDVNK